MLLVKSAGDKFLPSQSINDYPINALTKTNISTVFATNNGYPLSKAGELLTDNLIAEYGRQRQTYTIYNSGRVFNRRTNADGSWSAWEDNTKNILLSSDSVLMDTPISYFKEQSISYTQISNAYASANGFPAVAGGTLTTIRTLSDTTYGIQYYRLYNSNETHSRSVKSDGTWGAWNSYKINKTVEVAIPSFTIPANGDYTYPVTWADVTTKSIAVGNCMGTLPILCPYNIQVSSAGSLKLTFVNVSGVDKTHVSNIWRFTLA